MMNKLLISFCDNRWSLHEKNLKKQLNLDTMYEKFRIKQIAIKEPCRVILWFMYTCNVNYIWVVIWTIYQWFAPYICFVSYTLKRARAFRNVGVMFLLYCNPFYKRTMKLYMSYNSGHWLLTCTSLYPTLYKSQNGDIRGSLSVYFTGPFWIFTPCL